MGRKTKPSKTSSGWILFGLATSLFYLLCATFIIVIELRFVLLAVTLYGCGVLGLFSAMGMAYDNNLANEVDNRLKWHKLRRKLDR
jgi:hypothetical protein